jgi:hypothetical protein
MLTPLRPQNCLCTCDSQAEAENKSFHEFLNSKNCYETLMQVHTHTHTHRERERERERESIYGC